ncbi:NAD-dependent epimerase/dehydratase family protein [Flavobacteriaceae bacterium]|nr:NAD-dependent epimerase/dehydratase family protein [Flavobacteriaceae bacterium]
MSIYLTGASGFVGKNLVSSLDKNVLIKKHVRDSEFLIKQNTVIHLAGKAHDLKNISNKDEYYEVNTELTKQIFDSFLISDSSVFIMLSSVKAVADNVVGILNEDCEPNPKTHYGKSKLLAESYILSKKIPNNKRVYILRPCMIHGPNNKGNLNLLYNLVSKRIPWILGSFQNKRSYCSIDNLLFIINELIKNNTIPSGVYNVADDEYLSTNEIISLISNSNNQKPIIFNLSPFIVKFIAKIGDIVPLPLNSERLKKLTESYMVSNEKLKKYIAKELPLTSKEGVIKTLKSFKN